MAPGANIGDNAAIFEATHGTAPKHAGLNKINPGSVILSNGLNADYVYLEGQILTGISVVTSNLKNYEKLPVVTHPGNIGTKDSLVNIWKVFENKINFKN